MGHGTSDGMLSIGYARISKKDTAEDTDALEQQIARLRRAGAEEILIDTESGYKNSDSRRQFQQMLRLVKEGKVSQVIVTRMDRLGRSILSIYKAVELLEKHKVDLKILDAPVDAGSPFGWFHLQQMAGLAEFESRLLSNRVKHGYAYLREQGKACPNAPFGYKRWNEHYLPNHDPHPCGVTYWEVARGIVEAYLEAQSLRSANQLLRDRFGITRTPSGLRDYLTNPVLQGHTVYGRWGNERDPSKWDVRRNTHEALISTHEAQQIEALLKRNRSLWGFNKKTIAGKYPLSGQITCARCGGKAYLQKSRKNRYVMCRKSQELTCTNTKTVRHEVIIAAVVEALSQRAEEIATAVSEPKEAQGNPEAFQLQNELSALRSIPNPSIAIKMAVAEIEARLSAINVEEAPAEIDAELRDRFIAVFQHPDTWLQLTDEQLQEAFLILVAGVSIDAGEVVSIDLNF